MGIGPWNTEEENFDEQFDNNNEQAKRATILQAMAKQAVKNLTEKQRTIWQLFNNDGLTQDEIAIKLKISQPVVSKHLKAAEKSLQKWGKEHSSMFDCLTEELGPQETFDKPNGWHAMRGSENKTPIRRTERDGEWHGDNQ